jgi:hypothetical protein
VERKRGFYYGLATSAAIVLGLLLLRTPLASGYSLAAEFLSLNMEPADEVVRREAVWFGPTADSTGPLLDAMEDLRVMLVGD